MHSSSLRPTAFSYYTLLFLPVWVLLTHRLLADPLNGVRHTCLIYLHAILLAFFIPCPLAIVSGVEGRGRQWSWAGICQTWWFSPTLLPHKSVWMKVKGHASLQTQIGMLNSFACPHFLTSNHWHCIGTPADVLSFSETRAQSLVNHRAEQFLAFNQRQLSRIYPSAYRIDSSNFNPQFYWNVGCQLGKTNVSLTRRQGGYLFKKKRCFIHGFFFTHEVRNLSWVCTKKQVLFLTNVANNLDLLQSWKLHLILAHITAFNSF